MGVGRRSLVVLAAAVPVGLESGVVGRAPVEGAAVVGESAHFRTVDGEVRKARAVQQMRTSCVGYGPLRGLWRCTGREGDGRNKQTGPHRRRLQSTTSGGVELLSGIAAVRTAQVAGSTVAIVQMCRLSCREPICGSNLYYVGRRNQSKWGVWGGLTGLNLVGRRKQFACPGWGRHIGATNPPKSV